MDSPPITSNTMKPSPINIVLLSRYSRLGASSRLRTMQYLPHLTKAGVDVQIEPLFDDAYLHRLYAGKTTMGSALRAYSRRLQRLLALKKPDLLWIEKEVLPWLPWPLERALFPRTVPIVSDYDDAVFHRYEMHSSSVVRRLLGAKIDRVMAASALVVAGSSYLAARAQTARARNVSVIPTVVDLEAYAPGPAPKADEQLRIGWIGTPSTWSAYVEPLLPMLRQLASTNGARLRAVGAGRTVLQDPAVEVCDWSEEGEVELIQGMHIGIMPLDDSPWARGKCGYKLIQYMACGLPVVASPVGVNKEIVEHGRNGFLADSESEWREALTTLLCNPNLRRRMGQAGRQKVEENYSLQVHGPRVAEMLREIAMAGKHQD